MHSRSYLTFGEQILLKACVLAFPPAVFETTAADGVTQSDYRFLLAALFLSLFVPEEGFSANETESCF